MKILLINSPSEGRTPSNFPIGLGYIAKILINERYNVKVLDIFTCQYTKEEVLKIIPTLKYDVVGISAISTQYSYVKWISKELKKYHKEKIILGGALPTFSSEIVLKNTEIDICVIGEGEETIKDLMKNLNNLKKVKGIHFKKGDKIIKNPEREYIKDLDTIPFPAWELFPMEIYLKTPTSQEGYVYKSMNIVSSRGCPYNCKFCSKTFKGYRMRSIDNVIKEIKELIKKYGVKVIDFNDELVMINKKRMYELCEKIAPLKIKWSCQGRTNIADHHLLKTMKKSGCFEVGYGIESGSQKILDNMNKVTTVENHTKAIMCAKKVGIRPTLQAMFGYVGETKETVKETIDFYKRVHAHPDGCNITTPTPGSPLYEEVKQEGLIKDEEKYLEQLKMQGQFTINLTDIPNKELLELKKWSDKMMYNNYYKYRRRHLFIFLKDYTYKIKRMIRYIRLNGIKKTLSDVSSTLKESPELIFQAERP